MSLAPTYRFEPPPVVEALQWLPDDPEAAKEMLWWLVRRSSTFRFEWSGDSPDRIPYIWISNRVGGDSVIVGPTDWIVRDGWRAFSVWENEDFLVRYHPTTDDLEVTTRT